MHDPSAQHGEVAATPRRPAKGGAAAVLVEREISGGKTAAGCASPVEVCNAGSSVCRRSPAAAVRRASPHSGWLERPWRNLRGGKCPFFADRRGFQRKVDPRHQVTSILDGRMGCACESPDTGKFSGSVVAAAAGGGHGCPRGRCPNERTGASGYLRARWHAPLPACGSMRCEHSDEPS